MKKQLFFITLLSVVSCNVLWADTLDFKITYEAKTNDPEINVRVKNFYLTNITAFSSTRHQEASKVLNLNDNVMRYKKKSKTKSGVVLIEAYPVNNPDNISRFTREPKDLYNPKSVTIKNMNGKLDISVKRN